MFCLKTPLSKNKEICFNFKSIIPYFSYLLGHYTNYFIYKFIINKTKIMYLDFWFVCKSK
jgi:uncharacterized membrane protein (GlpM family)